MRCLLANEDCNHGFFLDLLANLQSISGLQEMHGLFRDCVSLEMLSNIRREGKANTEAQTLNPNRYRPSETAGKQIHTNGMT